MKTETLKTDLTGELNAVDNDIDLARKRISKDREIVKNLLEEKKEIERVLNAMKPRKSRAKKDTNVVNHSSSSSL